MRRPARALCVAALAALAFAPTAGAQLRLSFQPREDLNARLPLSIRAYQADTLLKRGTRTEPVRVFLVRADTSDASWEMRALLSANAGGVQTVTSFALDSDALIAVNGGYFGGGQSFSLVAEDGQVKSPNIGALNRGGTPYYPTRGAFGLLQNGAFDVAWVYAVSGQTYYYPAPSPNTTAQPQPQPTALFPAGGALWPLDTGVGGGPVLVENGRRRITWEEEVFFGSGIGDTTDLQPRTAVGYTPEGELLLVVVDGRQTASTGMTLIELADLFVGLGAREALNLDGGGSSALVVANTLVNRPEGGTSQRPVAAALVLARPAEVVVPDEGFIFDTGDAGYSETGDWFESANTPFWGDTKARLNAVGTGADRAVFHLSGFAAGRYTVGAWWVPSFNRATNTPFTIYHDGQPTTVRVDQTPGATQGQWNALGEFTLAPGDSIVVSDDAAGTTSSAFVVADALRLVPAVANAARPDGAPEAAFHLWPSPARDRVTITGGKGAQHGDVFDVTGRRVAAFEFAAGQAPHTLDVSGWSPGVYAVRLTGAQGTRTRLLVVAR